jgi:hypothetical protein
MSTGTTVTCVCGSHGFIVIDATTGEQVDLKTYYATRHKDTIDPNDLKSHDLIDVSNLRMVCANPECRRVL